MLASNSLCVNDGPRSCTIEDDQGEETSPPHPPPSPSPSNYCESPPNNTSYEPDDFPVTPSDENLCRLGASYSSFTEGSSSWTWTCSLDGDSNSCVALKTTDDTVIDNTVTEDIVMTDFQIDPLLAPAGEFCELSLAFDESEDQITCTVKRGNDEVLATGSITPQPENNVLTFELDPGDDSYSIACKNDTTSEIIFSRSSIACFLISGVVEQ